MQASFENALKKVELFHHEVKILSEQIHSEHEIVDCKMVTLGGDHVPYITFDISFFSGCLGSFLSYMTCDVFLLVC